MCTALCVSKTCEELLDFWQSSLMFSSIIKFIILPEHSETCTHTHPQWLLSQNIHQQMSLPPLTSFFSSFIFRGVGVIGAPLSSAWIRSWIGVGVLQTAVPSELRSDLSAAVQRTETDLLVWLQCTQLFSLLQGCLKVQRGVEVRAGCSGFRSLTSCIHCAPLQEEESR